MKLTGGLARMKRSTILMLMIVVLAGLPIVSSGAMTIAQLLNDPSAYDGKHVSVSGTVKHLRQEVSSNGQPFVIFALCSTITCVHVFGWGSPNLRNDRVIMVQGTFAAVQHFAGYTFHDGIHADSGSL